jgi:hypothetical protein
MLDHRQAVAWQHKGHIWDVILSRVFDKVSATSELLVYKV